MYIVQYITTLELLKKLKRNTLTLERDILLIIVVKLRIIYYTFLICVQLWVRSLETENNEMGC